MFSAAVSLLGGDKGLQTPKEQIWWYKSNFMGGKSFCNLFFGSYSIKWKLLKSHSNLITTNDFSNHRPEALARWLLSGTTGFWKNFVGSAIALVLNGMITTCDVNIVLLFFHRHVG